MNYTKNVTSNDICIKDIQEKLFEMMNIFHNICSTHSINYYMVGGTMLGAIRHQGFIPWDDDMDLALPRKDYEKLLNLPKSVWPSYIQINSPINTSNHPYAYSKLNNTGTTLVEDVGKGFVQGLNIDIFPLDGAGNSKKSAVKHQARIARLKMCLYITHFTNYKNKPLWKNPLIRVIRLVGSRHWQMLIKNGLLIFDFDSSCYVGNLVGLWGRKEIMPREYFGQPTLYRFGESEFYGPEKYDKYLSCLYGDYMKPPPIEKQKSHHKIKYLNLDLPFEKYLKES